VALKNDGAGLALRVLDRAPRADAAPPRQPSAIEKVEQTLAYSSTPMSLAALRAACHIRKDVSAALATLASEGRVRKTAAGYLLASK
jgi:chaperone required for assembly of F1-ATPase